MERCRNGIKFKTSKDSQRYESLTKALHQAIATSMNQQDRDRFLINFRRYIIGKQTTQKKPYEEDPLVNQLIKAMVAKLKGDGCFVETIKSKKPVLVVSPKSFASTGVHSIVSTHTERFESEHEFSRSSSQGDTDSSAHSSGESSPTSSHTHSPVRPIKPLPAAPPADQLSPRLIEPRRQGRVRKPAQKIAPLVTNNASHPVYSAGQKHAQASGSSQPPSYDMLVNGY